MSEKYLISYLENTWVDVPEFGVGAIKKETSEIHCVIRSDFSPTEKGIRKFENNFSHEEGRRNVICVVLAFSKLEE